MKVYQTNPQTGEYIHAIQADESPLEKGVFLIPYGAYEDAPPRKKTGHTIFREGDKWVHRKNESAPNEAPEGIPSEEGVVRQERDRLINEVEWRLSRFERQERMGIETTDPLSWYEACLEYVQELRDLPEKKGFPSKVKFPEIKEK